VVAKVRQAAVRQVAISHAIGKQVADKQRTNDPNTLRAATARPGPPGPSAAGILIVCWEWTMHNPAHWIRICDLRRIDHRHA
jgi:hypothetical protein